MNLRRRVAALEKRQAEIAAIAAGQEEQDRAERLHRFWDHLQSELQAQGHWWIPGEEFFRYLTRAVGFDYGRLRRALKTKDAAVAEEFMATIWQRAPDLRSTWTNACPGSLLTPSWIQAPCAEQDRAILSRHGAAAARTLPQAHGVLRRRPRSPRAAVPRR
jgi:hypothetical protein